MRYWYQSIYERVLPHFQETQDPAVKKALHTLYVTAYASAENRPPAPPDLDVADIDDPRFQGTERPLALRLLGPAITMAEATDAATDGSLLATVRSQNGLVSIVASDDPPTHPRNAFWAAGTPPSWAHDWGTDPLGPWADISVPAPDGAPVRQRLRWCPPGSFLMGSPPDDPDAFADERPQHRVAFAAGFWMFDTACTEALWTAVTGRPRASPRGPRYPVTDVSWHDAQDFVAALNRRRPGLALALPSEAQWEYACRAGSETAYGFGGKIDRTQVNFDNDEGTVPAASLPPNPWGLHEMHGNVWEWCDDHWHGDYTGAPTDGSPWHDARAHGAASRVLRGGSWFLDARDVRSACRIHDGPSVRNVSFGFRCARVPVSASAEQAAVPAAPASQPLGAERGWPPGSAGAAVLLRPGEAAASPPPASGAVIVRTDRETLTLRPYRKPAWASAIGRDRFGLVAAFTVPGTDVSQRMRWIPPGRFQMGSPDDEPGRDDDEGPRHEVTLQEGFWLFDTPCTQTLWQAVTGSNPSRFKSPARPVETVSFDEAQAFIDKLNQKAPGLHLALPSEAQWEYACRAGTETATYAGPIDILGANNAPALDPIAWYGGNSGQEFDLDNGFNISDWPDKQYPHTRAGTRIVGQKSPNAWGLHDMLGNVWEWCADIYHPSYEGAPSDGSPRLDARTGGAAYRVLRGGSWLSVARDVRSAYRYHFAPTVRFGYFGFRCARVQRESGALVPAQGREEQASGAERAAATTGPKRRQGLWDWIKPKRERKK